MSRASSLRGRRTCSFVPYVICMRYSEDTAHARSNERYVTVTDGPQAAWGNGRTVCLSWMRSRCTNCRPSATALRASGAPLARTVHREAIAAARCGSLLRRRLRASARGSRARVETPRRAGNVPLDRWLGRRSAARNANGLAGEIEVNDHSGCHSGCVTSSARGAATFVTRHTGDKPTARWSAAGGSSETPGARLLLALGTASTPPPNLRRAPACASAKPLQRRSEEAELVTFATASAMFSAGISRRTLRRCVMIVPCSPPVVPLSGRP